MTFAIHRTLAVSIVFAVLGCGTGDPDATATANPAGPNGAPGASTPVGTMHLSGIVRWQSSSGAAPTTLPAAEVKATIDRNRDGTVSADETWLATTDFDGGYTLDVPVNPGDTMVVRFTMDGSVPVLRTVKAGPRGNLILNATLRALEPLECAGASCSLQQGGLAVKGLPAGASGGARIFNPVTETDAFPGDFNESTGKLLVSGVFASFDLRDGSGKAIDKLASPVELRLLLPRATWSVVSDVAPGNNQIDVPLYAFDEVKGTWVRDANTAHLEDGNGNVVAPTSLASIRNGSFTGALYAVGNVSHIAIWNVDWPVEGFSCISGRLLDETGKPAEGATVSLRGVTYTGTSTPVTVGADGRFCLEAMRSEPPGQDLDGNGTTGEKAIVSISAFAAGKVYNLGEFATPTAQAACGGAGCFDVGDLRLNVASLRTLALCTVTGTVKYLDGTAAEGAAILVWDASVPEELVQAFCDAPEASCAPLDFTDANGFFTVAWPMMGDLHVSALGGRSLEPGTSELLMGERNFASCPKAPLALTLDSGFIVVQLTVAVGGNAISWTPGRYGISLLQVVSPSGGIKWEVSAQDGKVMRAPLQYGVVPAGATQTIPSRGAPLPLAPGDIVSIFSSGGSIDGLPYFGSADGDVP